MSSFLYYIPKKSGISEVDLKLVGLDILSSYSQVGCMAGPDGKTGCLVCEEGPSAPKITYNKETQTWKKCYGGKYWIGYEKDNRPGPEDLLRKSLVDGYDIILSDGNKWLCPAAKALPSYLGINTEGVREKTLKPEYTHLSKLGDTVFQAYEYEIGDKSKGKEPSEDIKLTDEQYYDITIQCLQTNYRVGEYELDALELMTPQDMNMISLALISFPTIVDEKKNEDADSTSGD